MQQQRVRFTPEAAALFRLRPSDIGRPIGNVNNSLDDPELPTDLGGVSAGGTSVEREVPRPAGTGFLVRVLGDGEWPGAPPRAVRMLIAGAAAPPDHHGRG